MMVSKCCGSEVVVRFISGGDSDYYECHRCGNPAEVICSFVPFGATLDEVDKVLHETLE